MSMRKLMSSFQVTRKHGKKQRWSLGQWVKFRKKKKMMRKFVFCKCRKLEIRQMTRRWERDKSMREKWKQVKLAAICLREKVESSAIQVSYDKGGLVSQNFTSRGICGDNSFGAKEELCWSAGLLLENVSLQRLEHYLNCLDFYLGKFEGVSYLAGFLHEFKCCMPFDPGGSWKHRKLLGLQHQFSKVTRDLLHDSQDWGGLNVDTRVAPGISSSQVSVSKVKASSKIKIQVNAYLSGSIQKVGDNNDCGTLTKTRVFELFAAAKDFKTQFCFAARKQLISSGNNKLDSGLIFRLLVLQQVMNSERNGSQCTMLYAGNGELGFASTVKELGSNIFLLSFEDPDDRQRILMETPWSIAGHHLVIKEWSCSKALLEVDFSLSECWVQVHGLSPAQISKDNGWVIGSMFESCLAVDMSDDNKLSYSGVLRLRVLFHVHKPLLPGFYVSRPSGRAWVAFIYEKMSDFCFTCGCIDHREKACNLPRLPPCSPFTPKRFGLWMKTEAGFAKWMFSKLDWTSRHSSPPPDSGHLAQSVPAPSSDTSLTAPMQVLNYSDDTCVDLSLEGSHVLPPGALNANWHDLSHDLAFKEGDLSRGKHAARPVPRDSPLVDLRLMTFDSPKVAASVLHQYSIFGELLSGALPGGPRDPLSITLSASQHADDIPCKPRFGFKRYGPADFGLGPSKRARIDHHDCSDVSSMIEYTLDYSGNGPSTAQPGPYFRVFQKGSQLFVIGRETQRSPHLRHFKPTAPSLVQSQASSSVVPCLPLL
ncbi:hypothetical protein Tsubulata_013076 [Turnera subulata]|uniref:DUF4283 domain-containing protein n=1 Tax=Turnera subulata TaxID=218843 RepID=A0A9Q0F3A5_9ROSI|nr:hypothetical protein Tsubulata_013076 [Turnera subulata]